MAGYNTTDSISDTSKTRRFNRLWLCGIGAGIALAFGLKSIHDTDAGNYGLCDAEVSDEKRRRSGRYDRAIGVSRDLVQRIKDEVAAPGLVIGVSVDGQQVWCEGFGYADLENRMACRPETVMRIASVSKSLTTTAVGRLVEEGKLDLDLPIQQYVPEFPAKQFDGEDVTITTRMILSHLSGIRHYERDAKKVRASREKASRAPRPPACKEPTSLNKNKSKDSKTEENIATTKESKQAKSAERRKEFDQEEYYLKTNIENVVQALDLFKDDPLIFKPGSTFLYSTHAFTLLSAVVERAAGQGFVDHMKNLFHELGMVHTVPEENEPIIYHRSRFYHLNKKGRVVNCPYVDNSYKWAGGGFLSTAGDLLLFGNALLYSYQLAQLKDTRGLLPGFLRPQTSLDLWAPVYRPEPRWDKDGLYAQGWLVVEKSQKYGQCKSRRHYVSHTGGAVGASSVLLILPSEETLCQPDGTKSEFLPQGVVVSIITNMQSVGLNSTALKIAYEFDKACKRSL
ncbi:hypothetical protein CRUP_030510 [Coryphaenoides rupestris]|nr:hypothetical protein CRUP_030510 [Coryphaenoides rupestris]